MQRFYLLFGVASALSVAGAFFVIQFLTEITVVPSSYWIALSFIAALTFAVHHLLVKANDQSAQRFVTYFMGALSAKLFLSCMVLIAIGLIDPDSLTFTALGFMVAYVLYTAVEIADLLPRMRNKPKQ